MLWGFGQMVGWGLGDFASEMGLCVGFGLESASGSEAKGEYDKG
jgi:hypothetical protein